MYPMYEHAPQWGPSTTEYLNSIAWVPNYWEYLEDLASNERLALAAAQNASMTELETRKTDATSLETESDEKETTPLSPDSLSAPDSGTIFCKRCISKSKKTKKNKKRKGKKPKMPKHAEGCKGKLVSSEDGSVTAKDSCESITDQESTEKSNSCESLTYSIATEKSTRTASEDTIAADTHSSSVPAAKKKSKKKKKGKKESTLGPVVVVDQIQVMPGIVNNPISPMSQIKPATHSVDSGGSNAVHASISTNKKRKKNKKASPTRVYV